MSIQTCKFVAIGDGAVGKTAMLVSYTSNSTPTDYQPTVFDNYNAISMWNDQPVNLGLWDTAGQDDYDHLRLLSYPQTDCFIVCFSLVSPTSYQNVISKWVPEIKHHCPDVPIVLVGTKIDLRDTDSSFQHEMKVRGIEAITTERGKDLATRIEAAAYVECSAITQQGLKDVFDKSLDAWSKYREKKRKNGRKANSCGCEIM